MSNVAVKCHLDAIVWAVAVELSTREVILPLCDALVDQWVKWRHHGFNDGDDEGYEYQGLVDAQGSKSVLLGETNNVPLHSENRALFITSQIGP